SPYRSSVDRTATQALIAIILRSTHTSAPLYYDACVGKYDKLLLEILRGASDANIPFDDLCRLLTRLGFEERIRGSHHLFRQAGVEERINCNVKAAKPRVYQVRQVRAIILKYRLGEVE